jgi:hypothetical protein
VTAMTRVDRYEAALQLIALSGEAAGEKNSAAVARIALEDANIDQPGELREYRSREDWELARQWLNQHIRADHLIFDRTDGHGRAIAAVYFEPVAEHYYVTRQQIRAFLRKVAVEFGLDM